MRRADISWASPFLFAAVAYELFGPCLFAQSPSAFGIISSTASSVLGDELHRLMHCTRQGVRSCTNTLLEPTPLLHCRASPFKVVTCRFYKGVFLSEKRAPGNVIWQCHMQSKSQRCFNGVQTAGCKQGRTAPTL